MNRQSIVAGVLFGALFLSPAAVHAADTPTHTARATSSSDAATMAKLVAINQHEIRAAKLAVRKKVSPAVLEYARMLQREHEKNLAATRELQRRLNLRTSMSPVRDIYEKNSAERSRLDAHTGESFERAYLNAMVKGHDQALKILDEGIRASTLPEVKAHLEATRGHVEHHLAQARQLQQGTASARK